MQLLLMGIYLVSNFLICKQCAVNILVYILHIWGFLKNKFIYLWLHWVFVALRGLLIAVASLVVEHGL